jgi:hypothetical protein
MRYKRQECILTQEEVEVLCKDWQERLGLENWDIKIWVTKAMDIEDGKASGNCNFVVKKRTALIKIIRHEDWDFPRWPHDMEGTLVHELLHCHMCGFDGSEKDSAEDINMEQVVEQLAVTLVGMKRETNVYKTGI